MQFIKHQSDDDNSWIKGKTRFEHVEKEAVELINIITGSNITGDEKEEVVNMCKAWDNSISNAEKRGKIEGRAEGINIAQMKIILNMYNNNFTIEQIALATQYNVDEINRIISEEQNSK